MAQQFFTPSSAGQADTSSLVAAYIPLVHFLGEAVGPNCEVVLHDLSDPEQSIVAIANGHISGRSVGGPVTDFALKSMRHGATTDVTTMTGYRAINAEGRICRSSSFLIRDEQGALRGMLCINVDITELETARDSLISFLAGTEEGPGVATISDPVSILHHVAQVQHKEAPVSRPVQTEENLENLRSSLQGLLDSMLDTAVGKHNVGPERMQSAERMEVVADLDEAGFFMLKGGIAAAAKRLHVSEPTIYRYLVKARA